MPETTDKDRKKAKKLCEKLRVIVNGENCYPFDEPEHIENLALWVAHLRAEAYADALAAMAPCIEAYESALKDKTGECAWTESPEGYWLTSCGRSWTFIEGGPEDNGIRYCHGCGKPVRIADEPKKGE